MKGYVIKNKEGKYRDKEGWLSNNLLDVDIFKDYELALSACLSDEKPVEITITEGNLEKNQKAIECLREALKYCNETYYVGNGFSKPQNLQNIKHFLDNKIKELEGNNDTAR